MEEPKCLYFLQALRDVDLGYDFRLHAYGPFDSRVLDDLDYAGCLRVTKSEIVHCSGGYRYEFRCDSAAEEVKASASEFVSKHNGDFDWVIGEFGNRSAADLEMISTIIYVDRELLQREEAVSLDDLAGRVAAVKPHLKLPQIQSEARSLLDKGLLQAVCA